MTEAAKLEHKMAMHAVGFAAQILDGQAEYLRRFVEAERSMHSFMHITDPTMYIRALNDRGLAHQVRLAKAALAFLAEVNAVRDALGGEQG